MRVPLTKSTLLRFRETLAGAEQARDLLEQRREILLAELLRHVHRRREYRRKLREAINKAVSATTRVRMVLGATGLQSLMLAPVKSPTVRIWHESVMGARVPRVEPYLPEPELARPLMEGGGWLEEADAEFRTVLEILAPWLEAEGASWSLAIEVARTQRKVAALEKMVIPEVQRTVRQVEDALDEAEREDYFRRKRLKAARGNS